MKAYATIILAAVLVSACVSKEPSSSNPQPAAGAQSTPAKAESSQTAASQPVGGAPVEFTFGGITPDKTNISYRIKVNTDKPIDKVHLALKEMDAAGKVLEQTAIVWQNIVGSTRKPIENGKTYEDQTPLDPGATKVECSLKEVIFKDGSRWSVK